VGENKDAGGRNAKISEKMIRNEKLRKCIENGV
jgi:hypothetical protein